MNLGDGFEAPQPGTPDFEDISNTISDSFGPTLEKLPGYYRIKLNELEKNGDDGVIAKMNLILNKNEGKGRSLKPADTVVVAERALKVALVTGRVGSLTVDPQYLVVRPPLCKHTFNCFIYFDNTRTILAVFHAYKGGHRKNCEIIFVCKGRIFR